jgi:hypothetical protein
VLTKLLEGFVEFRIQGYETVELADLIAVLSRYLAKPPT